MSITSWLLFAHILAAIVWLGGGLMLMLVAIYVRSTSDPDAIELFARVLPFAALRSLTPAVIVLLVSGVWMILSGVGWSFSQLWVQLALVLFALAFVIGALYMSRVALQLERSTQSGAPEAAAARHILGRWLAGYGTILLILLVAVWDMIFKPGL